MSALAKRLIQENIEKYQRGEDATYLDLGNCGLPHLPEEIKELVWLETLILSSKWDKYNYQGENYESQKSANKGAMNLIADIEGIQFLSNLKVLILGDEFVDDDDKGLSPLYNLNPLSNLENLQILHFNSTLVSDLRPLSNLLRLQDINCYFTNISDLKPLASLENLKRLNCSATRVSNLRPLEKLINLNELKCSNTRVKNLDPLVHSMNLQELSLSFTRVSDLAPLSNLTNLQILWCHSTQVSDLSPLSNLMQLKKLNCSETRVHDLSPLANLMNLKELSFYSTQISSLRPLTNLINLQQLNCSHTEVSNLAPLINLGQLKKIYCSSTRVYSLSPIANLVNLQELNCSSTQVSNLYYLSKLTNLQKLLFDSTEISDLSPLSDLVNLKYLWCSNTKVSDLSPLKKLLQNSTLKSFKYKDCPLNNPPYEYVEKGIPDILNYWEQIEKQGGVQTINEAKLIIVGEGKTGKTTLYNKLIDPAYDLNANPTDETHGINTFEGLEIKEGFRVNLWDFGGQDLQYMTHQFFLSPRALYVLVMDARTESPNLPYWFRIISLLGKERTEDKVSLILVINRQKGGTGRPQFEDLLRLYENDFDVEIMEVDLAINDKRWESLHDSIIRRLEDLPIVKNPLPKQWNPIREALRIEAEKKAHIPLERLHEICAAYGVDEEKDQLQMTGYLHQLGSILHFQNDDLLVDTVILQTKWAVEGVYTTLKNEDILKRNGRFTKDDLFHILRGKGYKTPDCTKVLRLMSKNNFDICYESRSSSHFVAAQWLPADRPKEMVWHKDAGALQFRYQYPVMPKGLMSRLIVRLSDYIEVMDGCEMVWKKGAVLRMYIDGSECRVFLYEDEDSKSGLKQIVVEVMEEKEPFQNRKHALRQVRDEVEDLHKRWFRNLKFEQIIPCNCQKCNFSTEPFTFLLSELQQLTKGRAYCNKLEDTVPILQLLEGVYQKEEIQELSPEHDPMRRMRDFERVPEVQVHIENKPVIQVSNQVHNNSQQDLAEIKKMLEQLEESTRAQFKAFVATLPEPDSLEEKTTLGKSILNWLNKNAEGVTMNVASSVYYDLVKAALLG